MNLAALLGICTSGLLGCLPYHYGWSHHGCIEGQRVGKHHVVHHHLFLEDHVLLLLHLHIHTFVLEHPFLLHHTFLLVQSILCHHPLLWTECGIVVDGLLLRRHALLCHELFLTHHVIVPSLFVHHHLLLHDDGFLRVAQAHGKLDVDCLFVLKGVGG